MCTSCATSPKTAGLCRSSLFDATGAEPARERRPDGSPKLPRPAFPTAPSCPTLTTTSTEALVSCATPPSPTPPFNRSPRSWPHPHRPAAFIAAMAALAHSLFERHDGYSFAYKVLGRSHSATPLVMVHGCDARRFSTRLRRDQVSLTRFVRTDGIVQPERRRPRRLVPTCRGARSASPRCALPPLPPGLPTCCRLCALTCPLMRARSARL